MNSRLIGLSVILSLGLSACGGGGGGGGGSTAPSSSTTTPSSTSITVPAAAGNTIPVSYTGMPGYHEWNRPVVSITVCNASGACSVVNNIILDTGSYGLRLDAGAMPAGFPTLPATTSAGSSIASCTNFVSGYTFGGVYTATVKIGGETASNINIQMYDDPNAPATPPTSCTSPSPYNKGNVASMGANGILGIGPEMFDSSSSYYTMSCAATLACQPISPAPTSIELPNPVSAFSADYNGFILTPQGNGLAASSTSTLTFGINTQADNQLIGYTMINADQVNEFNVSVTDPGGTVNTSSTSYFDTGTGSNVVYLANQQPTFQVGTSPYAINGIDANLNLPLTVASNVDATSYTGTLSITKASTDFPGNSDPYLSVPGFTEQLTSTGSTILGSSYYLDHDIAEILPVPGATIGGTNYYRAYGIH